MKCVTCHKNKAINSPQFGVIACEPCQKKTREITSRTAEIIPEHIKEEREQYKDMTEQPFRNGFLNKRYVELYGTSKIDVTEEEVKNSTYVFDRDLPGDYYKK